MTSSNQLRYWHWGLELIECIEKFRSDDYYHLEERGRKRRITEKHTSDRRVQRNRIVGNALRVRRKQANAPVRRPQF